MRSDDSGSDDLAKDLETKADEYEVRYVLRDGKLVREAGGKDPQKTPVPSRR